MVEVELTQQQITEAAADLTGPGLELLAPYVPEPYRTGDVLALLGVWFGMMVAYVTHHQEVTGDD